MGQSLLPTGANTSTSTSLDTLRVRLLDNLTSTMNSLFQPILLYLVTNSFLTLAVNGKCHLPEFDNGVVEAEGEEGGNFLKGEFRCNTDYTMSGPSMLKCRNGIWSGTKPVCSVAGCDPNNLPHFVNGRKLRVKGTRDSVFKYKCNRGFRLFGPKNVYCTKSGWKMDELPVCTRVGCNEEELLGNGIPHGRQRSMFQGAVYRFYCESGAMMDGNSAVYCDGYSWNSTKPECLVPPTTPVLSIELDGVVASEPLARVGQQIKLVCTAQGGNPFPTLAFMLNGERVEGGNKEMIEHGGYNAVHTFTVEDHHKNLDMSCIAENRMSSIPVASNHQTLSVKFGPSSTYIHGAEMIMPDGEADYSCTSDVSNPASDITVQVTDQDGNDIAIEVTKPPMMKENGGFASALQFKFQVLPHFKSIFMKCEAANDVGQASTGLTVHVMNPPSNIQITGPDYLLSTDDESDPNNIFTCTTEESNPVATIDWIVEADGGMEAVQEEATLIETINQGTGWKKISTLSLPSYQTESVKVHCIATIEDLGFIKMSEDLVVDVLGLPLEVSIIGPDFILLNSVNEFECVTQQDDRESLVSIHVSTLNREPVDFLMESDSKISITVAKALDGIIVDCFAENLAGQGPVQTKRVDVHSPPEVEIEGPEQLQPFNMLTYSCSTTNSQPETGLSWTVSDQNGQSVDFTEFASQLSETGHQTSVMELYANDEYDQLVVSCLATSQAGDGSAEITVYSVESPKLVQMRAPEKIEAETELTYVCESPLSSPQQSIRWEVTDWQDEVLQYHTEDPEVLDGYVTSLLYITAQRSAKLLNVKCVAYNDIGYVEDVSQEHVTYHPKSVELTGPSSVLASEEATFSCSSNLAYPAPSLMWSLDGQDVTRDADQTDNEQSEGGITSVSVLRLNPTMGGHNHLVKCFVGGLDIYREASLTVEELYEEDAYNDDSYEDDYSEEDIQNEYNYDEDEENKNDDSQYDNKENHDAAEKEVKEEIEYDYKEEEDNHEQGEEANDLTDYIEASIQDDHTETTNSVEQDLSAEEDDNNEEEEEYEYDEEEYNYDEDVYNYDEDDYNKTKEENVQDDKTEAVSQNNYEDSADLVEQELPTEKEDYIDESDATDYKEKEPAIEESFDAPQQQQSFAAAEP